MGEVELDRSAGILFIHSHIIVYGNAANDDYRLNIQQEIESLWNEPQAMVLIRKDLYKVVFKITGELNKTLDQVQIYSNTNGRNNYFRIEDNSFINISFVDGIGCNSGYFFTENLYKGSTTAAHEYGHTLGLDHPHNLDLRGMGQPGIMYPRGTLTDPQFQYDPAIPAGEKGGTLHPMYRRVLQGDIDLLKLHKLTFDNDVAQLGDFTNVYHDDHREMA
jgi:hypothetical protein